MFITKKQHNKIITEHSLKILKLEKELKDLRLVLEELANKTGIPAPKYDGYLTCDFANGVSWSSWKSQMSLPDDVLVYVDDILGGKVIKQEATKCLVISKDGKVTEGLTAQKPDKNYSYKLIRE